MLKDLFHAEFGFKNLQIQNLKKYFLFEFQIASVHTWLKRSRKLCWKCALLSVSAAQTQVQQPVQTIRCGL
jgi:hypothetical protein